MPKHRTAKPQLLGIIGASPPPIAMTGQQASMVAPPGTNQAWIKSCRSCQLCRESAPKFQLSERTQATVSQTIQPQRARAGYCRQLKHRQSLCWMGRTQASEGHCCHVEGLCSAVNSQRITAKTTNASQLDPPAISDSVRFMSTSGWVGQH